MAANESGWSQILRGTDELTCSHFKQSPILPHADSETQDDLPALGCGDASVKKYRARVAPGINPEGSKGNVLPSPEEVRETGNYPSFGIITASIT